MKAENRLLISLVLLLAIFASGVAGYRILGAQHDPPLDVGWIDSAYFTLITLTTIGYGETIPIDTPGAKLFTMLLIMVGVGTLSFTMVNGAAFLIGGEFNAILKRRRMDKEINKLDGHYIVCGCGTTGRHATAELLKIGRQVVVIDQAEKAIHDAVEIGVRHYIQDDATEDSALIEAGIERARGIIIALDSDQENVYVTVTARQLNSSIRIVAVAIEDKVADKLRKVGADGVVSPHVIGGLRIASEMVRPSVIGFLDIILRDPERPHRIEEVHAGEGISSLGQTLGDAHLNSKHRVLCLGMRDAGELIFNPTLDTQFRPGQVLFVMGDVADIERFREKVS